MLCFFCCMAFAQFGSIKQEPVQVEILMQENLEIPGIEIKILLELAPDVHIYTDPDRFFEIHENQSKGLGKMQLELPPPIKYKDIDGSIVDTYSGKQTLILKKPYHGNPGTAWQFSGHFQYQGCDKSTCYAPEKKEFSFQGKIPEGKEILPSEPDKPEETTQSKPSVETPEQAGKGWYNLIQDFEIAGSDSGYKNTEEFLAFLDRGETGKAQGDWSENLANKSLWLVILIILLGGLALNLTPCVLPMIPINLAIIGATAQGGSRKRGFFLGLIYGLAMSLTYGILGILVVLTGSQFGSLNSSPWFNLGIAIFFVVLSLAMFDVLTVDFSRFQSGSINSKKYGVWITPFIMGTISALLAGACIAPVVISVLIYSSQLYSSGQRIGLFLPFLLGIGMSIPWPFAGASLSFLPKPGAWMVKIKYAFGILIMIIALYYGYLGIEIWSATHSSAPSEQGQKHGWHTSLEQGLEEAKKLQQPVLIDFWASWCKNCLAMDKKTFQEKPILARLKIYTKIKYRAENFEAPETKPIIQHFQKALNLPTFGLPMYILLKPKKNQ